MTLSPEHSSRFLGAMRLAAVLVQLIAIAVSAVLFDESFPLWALIAVTSAFTAWHFLGTRNRLRRVPLSQRRLTVEVLVDVVTITAYLSLAGGWNNPFVSIYLVPIGFAAALLPARQALTVAAAAFVGYAFTIFVYVPLPAVSHSPDSGFNLHLLGMWMSFLLGSVVLLTTVVLVRRAYDQEREALAREREARLRDEQLLALGALAASTAHELGTPLSTARMLVETMEEEGAASTNDLARLGSHLDLVNTTLHRLVRLSDPDEVNEVDLVAFCLQLVDRFRTLRPDVDLRVIELPTATEKILGNQLLESALLSLMINAATASASAERPLVELRCALIDRCLDVRIRDYGHGITETGPEAISPNAGLGVGLVISSATIDRHGGTAHHYPCDPGTEVVVSLPLEALRMEP